MPDYRRAYVPGGTFFFTVVTYRRRPLFHDAANSALLGAVLRDCQRHRPFAVKAIVVLPDHLHTIWTLPSDDNDFSGRWNLIKRNFTRRYLANSGTDTQVSEGSKQERRRGIWQRRFWEHTIASEDDFRTHADYIHYNPVKHGLVRCPREWVPSSFHRWVERGIYPLDWGCSHLPMPTIARSADECGDVCD